MAGARRARNTRCRTYIKPSRTLTRPDLRGAGFSASPLRRPPRRPQFLKSNFAGPGPAPGAGGGATRRIELAAEDRGQPRHGRTESGRVYNDRGRFEAGRVALTGAGRPGDPPVALGALYGSKLRPGRGKK